MSYAIHGILVDDRGQAIRTTVEEFLWADGMNTPDEVARVLGSPDDAGDQDTPKNLAAELIDGWGGELRLSTSDETETVEREEWEAAFRQIVGVKYTDPEEPERLVWDTVDAREIEHEDPNLVVRTQWHPRDHG